MDWAIAILFAAAIVLLIISFRKSKDTSKALEQQIEEMSFTFMDEVNKLQQQIRHVELDAEITVQEAGIDVGTFAHRQLLREILELNRRGYSFDSIATKKQMSVEEVTQLLTPYIRTKDEGGKVSNDI
ncbi:hypothetical protein [Niallia endozanthoxylica]|uniref:DUF2802 domain-containing protein n=1 Tax=Niallia endozanthoxylica TaxID=2036016 RepID=A0A5J5HX27_9BACI|nr:hypothetical protein [Niallia endozanthoxylica]KAA9025662.1 hypothetical protein F4V44_07140 [Niallia endozanthoxylica]